MRAHRSKRLLGALTGAIALAFGVLPAAQAAAPTDVVRVSVDSGSGGGRELPAVSADADRIVFVGRGEASQGVWLRDRSDAATYRLTTGSHFNPAISDDGTTVAYVEYGSNRKIYLIDISDPANVSLPGERIDVNSDEQPSTGLSDFPALNDDGTLVAFHSTATNLDAGTALPTSGGPNKVYLRDVTAGTTRMISVDESGVAPPGNAIKPDLTPNGDVVVFASEQELATPAASLAVMAPPENPGPPDDHDDDDGDTTETFQQIYVKDLTDESVVVASVNDADELGNGAAALTYGPTISDDGTKVAFESDADNLAPFDSNHATDAFVRDLTAETTVRISEAAPFEQFGPLTPVDPVRLVDTRDADDPLGPGESLVVPIRGLNGVPATADAVAINLTVKSLTATAFLTVYPTGEDLPIASNINITPGDVEANGVTAKIGSDGSISVYNSAGQSHVIVDLGGYYDATESVSTDGGGFVATVPERFLDTRTTSDPLGAGETRNLQIAGVGDVPATAAAVALNVTAVRSTAKSHLTVFPGDLATPPLASNLNFEADEVIPNSVIVKLGADGSINLYNEAGEVNVVVDVDGYWDPAATNGGLVGVEPARLIDTRTASDPLGPDEAISLDVVGVGGVPATGVTGVVLNVTAVRPTAAGFLTVSPTGAERPLASNVNFAPGVNEPNQVLVAVGAQGMVDIYNSHGDTHLVVDVMAYFTGMQVADGGLGPAITGDGTAAAFESTSDLLTAGDVNGVLDIFLRTLASDQIDRASVAVDGGTEATGTRTDGHTGEEVPQKNGVDAAVGETADAVAFVSNGDLAADRPAGEEEGEDTSSEPASFLALF